MGSWVWTRGIGLAAWLVWAVCGVQARAQGDTTTKSTSCSVNAAAPGEADRALQQRKYEDAERLYGEALKADPKSGAAMAGLVRTAMTDGRLPKALELASRFAADDANDAQVQDALGEIRFRRGEIVEAIAAYERSLKLDACAGRTHYDVARYYNLNGLFASAQRELETAHKLAPNAPGITRAWQGTQRVPMTQEQQAARLRERLEQAKDTLSAEDKAALQNTIKAVEAREKGDCELTEPVTSAKVPMWASNSANSSARPPTNSGVDVYLNGKRRRFLVDTGASGLLLSSDAAKALGLTPEAEIKSSGIGDGGPKGAYLAHVESVKIGGMEFHNCMVRVLESKTMQWTDGLLGPDMFRSFLVTLDFPGGEMRLSPLPKRPEEQAPAKLTLGTSGEEEESGPEARTIAETRKDRYVAPEMQSWSRAFRYGHYLIFPTALGNAPAKLFIMDTGAGQNLVSPEAAREVTHVSNDAGGKVRGLSGDVNHVAGTDSLSLQFAHVRQVIPGGVNAIDMSSFSRGSGVEISGFIGYPILRELVVQIDYRDNLVNVTYTPHVEHGSR